MFNIHILYCNSDRQGILKIRTVFQLIISISISVELLYRVISKKTNNNH